MIKFVLSVRPLHWSFQSICELCLGDVASDLIWYQTNCPKVHYRMAVGFQLGLFRLALTEFGVNYL